MFDNTFFIFKQKSNIFLLYAKINEMNALPRKLVTLRKHYNYSQDYLASLLGVSVKEYMSYENGGAMIDLQMARRLAAFYHISLEEIFINDLELTLFEVSGASTDELNIEYFMPKPTLWQRLAKQKLLLSLVALAVTGALVLMGVFVWWSDSPFFTTTFKNINRLAASDTSVVYIDGNGGVKGSGSNANGQISSLPTSGSVKVAEGESFTAVLRNDGTVETCGLPDSVAKPVSTWKGIVDIAAGKEHLAAIDNRGKIYCVGSNGDGQCEVENFANIVKVFALGNGTIGINQEGKLLYCGEFIGSSQLSKHQNVIDVAGSNNSLVVLESDGSVALYTRGQDFLEVNSWKNIVDVAVGDDFVAALDSEGRVRIAIDNYMIREEVDQWRDIIAIASGKDYLVAFDGMKLYGVGKNAYLQFPPKQNDLKVLPAVSNVRVELVDESLLVQFDPVSNAAGYLVNFNLGTGLSYYTDVCQPVRIDARSLVGDYTYEITVVAVGDEVAYESSLPTLVQYHHPLKVVEEEVVISIPLVGISKKEFEEWLWAQGATNLVATKTDTPCTGSDACIISVTGISEHERLSKSELAKRQISYTYCVPREENNEQTEVEDPGE